MALQFVFGGSGSGKSNYLYGHILKQAKKEPDQLFFWVVPEQFTLQTQRELVKRQERHGIMNIDVVSFQRLAYRIFDELGLTQMKVLEETGKNFVLQKVAQQKKEELSVLKGSIKKNGYINEIKSMISELIQYRIEPKQLSELAQEEGMPMPFRMRMHDIQVMYQGFLDYLKGNYITPEEILQVLAKEAGASALLKDCILVLDGFTGFTPIQYELLGELMVCSKDIYVALTMDEREDFYHCKGMQDLFYLSKKTVETLSRIGRGHGIQIQDPVVLAHGKNTRFSRSKSLEWLEQNLFREEPKQYKEKQPDIYLYSLPNPRQELLFLAAEIQRLVREEGCRYREIAIVCGDVESYGNYASEIFGRYGIPYFLDKKNNISFHPFTELIKTAFQVVEKDFSYESILAYLRCGLSGVSQKEVDLLENYLLANRIRGWRRWQEKWVRLGGVENMEELDAANRVREQIVAQFGRSGRYGTVREVWRRKEGAVLEKTVALYEFITALNLQQELEKRRIRLEEQGRQALAREYAQIYRIVMDLLNKLTQLLAEEKMDLKEYSQILEAGFLASLVGIIPPGYDQVLIGDIERTRLGDVKVLFLAGTNDGLLPKGETQGGLISQKERELFKERNMELAPGTREKSFIQKFYLYLNLTKPSRKLYLTWWRTGGDGKEAKKSYLVGMVQRIFPGIQIRKLEEPDSFSQIVTEKSSRRVLVEGLRQARERKPSRVFLSLLSWFLGKKEYCRKAEELLDAAFYTYEGQFMSREATQELYGKILENSVTRLEQFSACAYAHFMAYGIRVRERQLGEFAPIDMGSLFHQALEQYSIKMEQQGYHWWDVPKEVQERLMEEAVSDAVENAGYFADQDASEAYTLKRLLRILKKTVEVIGSQILESGFLPEGYEWSFSFLEDLSSVNFPLGEEGQMRLKGRIDRVDVRKEGDKIYAKVVDYKSGSAQFSLVSLYHGLQLQLVVYLNAAVEMLKKKYPDKEVLPCGMFYYHIDDPVVEAKGNTAPEEIQKKIREQLKLEGVGLEAGDESVSKKSKPVPPEELKLLSEFADTKIRSIGKAVYQGDVQASPYWMKKESGCDYCPYHGICGFDLGLPGYGYRRLAEPKDKEELLEKMEKEVRDGNEIHGQPTAGH